MTDGKNEAEHIQELPKQWPTSGETLAYSKGMEAGGEGRHEQSSILPLL